MNYQPPAPRTIEDPRAPGGPYSGGRVGPLEMLLIAAVPLVLLWLFVRWVRGVLRRGAERHERERQERERLARRAQPPAVRVVERERVVERQVLVQRCRFCGQLTPVDLAACAECGAKL